MTLLEMLIALAILAAATLVVGRSLFGLLASEQAASRLGEAVWVVRSASSARLLHPEGDAAAFDPEVAPAWRVERLREASPGRGDFEQWEIRSVIDGRRAGLIHFGCEICLEADMPGE